MATERDDVKTEEPKGRESLVKTPDEMDKPGRERKASEPFRLGKRTYPVWTPAMVEARERYRRERRRWFLLYDKLYDDRNLREAWKQVEENGGAPGASGESIQEYCKLLEKRLPRLAERLKGELYEPRPIRRAFIPKHDGSGKQRELGIPEVEDRLVQAAIVRLIEPIFEDKFYEGSYGFRPERSAHHALSRVEQAIGTDRPFLVDADIRNCFGSIPHERLMQAVAEEIADPKLLRLISRFTKVDIVHGMERWTPTGGTPQGAVLSPLLANLHEFDLKMSLAGYEVVRYCDDFVVLCRSKAEADAAHQEAARVLAEMQLELHPEKTRVVDTREEGFQFLGYEWQPGGDRRARKTTEQKLRDRIRYKTPRVSGKSLRETIRSLNYTLRGFFAYFRYSAGVGAYGEGVFDALDKMVRRRLRSILMHHHKRRGTSHGRRRENFKYPNAWFRTLGLFSLQEAHLQFLGGRACFPFPAKA